MSWEVVDEVLSDDSVAFNVTDGRIIFYAANELRAIQLANMLSEVDYEIASSSGELRLAEDLAQARDELEKERLLTVDRCDRLQEKLSELNAELIARHRGEPWL
jgi:hypothetical protein